MYLHFDSAAVKPHTLEGGFGLEKESLRVTADGFLSHTKHPFDENPNIDRDFCENQTEIITGVCGSTAELCGEMATLHSAAVKTLLSLPSGKEYLWPFSNPPYVKCEDDIPIACFNGALKGKEIYRQYLAQKYGRRKMLFSGIHFNFSFSKELLNADFKESGYKDFEEYKSMIYLQAAQEITRYSWLIVYLTAASPVMDGSFMSDDDVGLDLQNEYASARCGSKGYWNDFIPILKYNSLAEYIDSILEYIHSGQLVSVSELYYPVRLKSEGNNDIEALQKSGINHIEVRTLDLNPLSPIGIIKEDIDFLHLLILYALSEDTEEFGISEQTSAIKNVKAAARFCIDEIEIEMGWNHTVPIKEAAASVLNSIEKFAKKHMPVFDETIKYQKRKVDSPCCRYADIIKERFGNDYVQRGLYLAAKYAENINEKNGVNV